MLVRSNQARRQAGGLLNRSLKAPPSSFVMGLVSTPAFLSISLCLSTPWLFQIFRKPRLLQSLLSLALLVHTLYSLHTLLVNSPKNIFTELKLPLNTPTDSIRAILLQRTSDTALPPETDRVLTKLKLLEVRRLYVRWVITDYPLSPFLTERTLLDSDMTSLPPVITANLLVITRFMHFHVPCFHMFVRSQSSA